MGVFADLKRRTGVGAGGVLLYVVLLGGIVAGVETLGDLPVSPTQGQDVEVFVPGLVVALGLLGVVSAVSNLPRALRLALARRGWDASAARSGIVEAEDGVLRSPVEGEDALCYSYRILENDVDDRPDPDDEENWSLAAMGEEGVPFVLRGGGRRVHVDPADADLHLTGRAETFLAADEDEPDSLAELRRTAGVRRDGATAHRYQETTLAPGDEAFVLGTMEENGRAKIERGDPLAVADSDYPARVRGRVRSGLLLGLPTTALGTLGLLFVAGAL